MKLFGEDPEISRLLQRQVDGLEVQLAEAKHEMESYRAVNGALQKENQELKAACLKLKGELLRAPRDPFAGWPAELKKQIDYRALGMEEPE